jgi:NAD(P)-dependent dehydrogenase (short-subunit alcohol dehydrogenase family)
MSFLEIEGLHVFVTGAAGGIGSAIVQEFLGIIQLLQHHHSLVYR